MAKIGARLREARLARGTTLQQIAAATKISVPALEAIEREDLARLPGGIFLRAFVRAYATEVGVDPDETVAAFLQQYPAAVSLGDIDVVAAVAEAAAPRPAKRRLVLVSVGLVVVVAAGAWTWTSFVRFAPALDLEETLVAEEVPAPPPDAIQNSAAVQADFELRAATPPDTLAGDSPGESVALLAREVAAPAPVASDGPPRLAIHPTGSCWVQVTMNGVVRFAREMRAGEREELDLTGPVLVRVGNAGAFAFTIDDMPGRPLGEVGQVVRVRIDPTRIDELLAQ